jgi:hypothetical protein
LVLLVQFFYADAKPLVPYDHLSCSSSPQPIAQMRKLRSSGARAPKLLERLALSANGLFVPAQSDIQWQPVDLFVRR